MKRRIIALVLATIMILVLVGCGSSSRQVVKLTLSTEDSQAILAAAGITLPDAEDTIASGTTVKWYAWYDDFHNYSEDEIVNTGYYTFTEKYGCEVQWIECTWDARFDDLANYVLASNSPDCYPGDVETFPANCIKGMFQAVDEYIDYDDPLWEGTAEFARTRFSLGDHIYMIITDVNTEHVVAYNRRVIDEYGYDDPAELYWNGEWTWDVFLEMCIDFSDADSDRYALDGWAYDNALMESSGTDVVTYDTELGEFVTNLDDPRLERAADLIYELKKNDCIYPVWNKGWQIRGGQEVEGSGIKEGLTLFWIRGTWAFTGTVEEMSQIWGDISEGEIMFCPLPRDDDGDGNHYVTINTAGYVIVSGAENPEGVALLASCERFKILDPTVVSIDRKQLEETYLWTEEMLEMYDHIHDLANGDYTVVVYDAGLGDKVDDTVNSCKEIGRTATASTWAQIKESYSERLDYYVGLLNDEVEAYNSAG